MNRFTRLTGLLVLIVASLVFAALPALAQDDVTPEPMPPAEGGYPLNTITVVGHGTASGTPDRATVDVGVEVFNADVTEAFAEANTTLENIVSALSELGISEDDINTSNLSVYNSPRYNPASGTEERGYTVSNTVRVIVRDIEQIEAVIDTAINAGATQLYGLNFSITDRSALETDARSQAMENAQARAEEYAPLIGATLGEVVVVAEANYGVGFPYAADVMSEGRGGGGGAFVAPGQTEVQIQVQVTYRIAR